MKRIVSLVISILLVFFVTGCSTKEGKKEEKNLMVVGFSQVGSESNWRAANTESMTRALSTENGYELLFENAKQNQENQFMAVRNFILQGVDIIVVAPVSEVGWENVLHEAKNAGIPVIVVDREVKVEGDNLYISRVGSDFYEEGRTAVQWLSDEIDRQNRRRESINILHIKGTAGSTAQILRSRALEEAAAEREKWNIAAQLNGEFTEAKGYEVVRDYLKTNRDIDVIYSENDNMTFGAMRALDEAGITYGEGGDVIIISFDAVREALEYCLEGKINLCVECNPLHGEIVDMLIKQYQNGENIPKLTYVKETCFTSENLTEEIIEQREY